MLTVKKATDDENSKSTVFTIINKLSFMRCYMIGIVVIFGQTLVILQENKCLKF